MFTFIIVSALDIALRFRDAATASSGSGLGWNTVRASRYLTLPWKARNVTRTFIVNKHNETPNVSAVSLCLLSACPVFFVYLGCDTVFFSSYQTAFPLSIYNTPNGGEGGLAVYREDNDSTQPAFTQRSFRIKARIMDLNDKKSLTVCAHICFIMLQIRRFEHDPLDEAL